MLRRIFPGESEAAARLRQVDWRTHELGTPDSWPRSARLAIGFCLASGSPAQVWLGPLRIALYNDASLRRFGQSPRGSARSGHEDDLWRSIGPTVEHVFADGVTRFCERVRLPAVGPNEDAWATFSLSALHDDSGAVVGVLGSCALMDPERASRELAAGEAAAAPATAPSSRRRVLVVEDNDDAARALKRGLELLGHVVALAHDGPVALHVARTFDPDVVLMDIGLPVMDGWELAKRLRELRSAVRHAPVVAVTAFDRDVDRQRSIDAGFVDHLVKPIDLAKLAQVVESLPLHAPS